MAEMKLPSVFVIGTRLWSKRLADQLSVSNKFKSVEIYDLSVRSIWKLFAIFKHGYIIRVGVRPGVLRPRGILVDMACLIASLFGVKIVVYWIGTDVHKTLKIFRETGGVYFKFWLGKSNRFFHAAGAPWLTKELREIGIKPKTLYFPSPLHVPDRLPPFPDKFTVLSYIPDSRHEFYGSAEIYACAKANPSIDFNIIAGRGTWVKEPLENLYFHGWVNDIEDYYASAVVVVRIVEHDALGATVREGWINGRYVIYTYKIENALYVEKRDSESLSLLLHQLKKQFDMGDLMLNESGYFFAKENFDPGVLTSRFIDTCISNISVADAK